MAELGLELFRRGVTETPLITFTSPSGEVKDPFQFRYTIVDTGNNKVLDTDSLDPPTFAKIRDGLYLLNFETSNYPQQEYLEVVQSTWLDEPNPATRSSTSRVFFIAPHPYFRFIPRLRLAIDKALKSIEGNVGYTEAQLAVYLQLGVTMINAIPPFTTLTVENFPEAYQKLLIDAATITALESQGVFSIDTDVDYSLGGNSLVVDHWSKLSSYLKDLVDRFNATLKQFKQLYRSETGTVAVQIRYGLFYVRYLSIVPQGFFARFGLGAFPVPGVLSQPFTSV